MNLGGVEYKSKAAIIRKWQEVCGRLREGKWIKSGEEFNFLRDLYSHHLDLTFDIFEIQKTRNTGFQRIRPHYDFSVRSVDGEIFEHIGRDDALSHAYSGSNLTRIIDNMRQAIKLDRDNYRLGKTHCEICGAQSKYCDVHHDEEFGLSFKRILDSWIRTRNGGRYPKFTTTKNGVNVFTSKELENSWREYHNHYAFLMFVCKECHTKEHSKSK